MSGPADVAREAARLRAGAGGIRLPERGVLDVSGSDRVRWLDGMISADVKSLATGGGAYGLLLTRQGRIVADLHVLARDEALWLDLESEAVPAVHEQLARFVVADDVTLSDRRGEIARLAVEGPGAARALAAAGLEVSDLAPEHWREVVSGGVTLTVAAFGLSGLPGFQLFVPAGGQAALEQQLVAAGLAFVSSDTLECLRIENGVPRLGRELDESVLPAEARLDAAVSTTKGCYTGQEVVTRMRSRGRVGHLLVGLRFEGEALPRRGAEIQGATGPIGQLTSCVRSPLHGAIGLGFVRAEEAAAGAAVRVDGAGARLAELPFQAPG